ncbi:MAG: hypothetical protein IKS54_06865 [Erysipelotrichaceae bacterium]|nr:hypothetical protein [Erysipelotrichaceae bacterium]
MKYYLKENFRLLYADGQLYNEEGDIVYTYENANIILPRIDLFKYGVNIGHIKKKFTWFLSRYDIIYGAEHMGSLQQQLKFIGSEMYIEDLGWTIKGDFLSMNYDIINEDNELIATVDQEIFRLTQRFYVDIYDEDNEELIVLLVLAINQFDKDRKAAASSSAHVHSSH